VGSESPTQHYFRVAHVIHLMDVVKRWDERTLVGKMELTVGRDLQYVRINGTLVGGLVGLLIHAATQLAAGFDLLAILHGTN